MTPSELLETQVTSSPASQARAERVEELPEDLLREATQRLGVLAAVWAGLFVIGIVMNDVVAPQLDLQMRDLIPWDRPADVVAVLSIAVSLWLWRYTRRLTCNPRQALTSPWCTRSCWPSASGWSTSGSRTGCSPGGSPGSACWFSCSR